MSAIVPFSIALTAIQGDPANLDAHRQFLPVWLEYGLWVEARHPRDVIRGIRSEAVQKLWADAFKEGLYCQRAAAQSVDDAMTVEQLRTLRGKIEVVCLGQAGLRRLGGGAAGAVGDAPEVTSIGEFVACASVRVARSQRKSGIIAADRDVAEVWREWFAATAQIAPTVAIADRYALCRGARRPPGKSGLERCLEFLRRAAGNTRVEVTLHTSTIVTTRDDPTEEEQRAWVQGIVDARGAADGSLKVFISPFFEAEHFRWIRLWRRAFTLDRGVEFFEAERTTKRFQIGIFDGGEFLTMERQLETLARERGVVITRRAR